MKNDFESIFINALKDMKSSINTENIKECATKFVECILRHYDTLLDVIELPEIIFYNDDIDNLWYDILDISYIEELIDVLYQLLLETKDKAGYRYLYTTMINTLTSMYSNIRRLSLKRHANHAEVMVFYTIYPIMIDRLRYSITVNMD